MITEFFTGGNLRDYRQRSRQLGMQAVKKWGRQVLQVGGGRGRRVGAMALGAAVAGQAQAAAGHCSSRGEGRLGTRIWLLGHITTLHLIV